VTAPTQDRPDGVLPTQSTCFVVHSQFIGDRTDKPIAFRTAGPMRERNSLAQAYAGRRRKTAGCMNLALSIVPLGITISAWNSFLSVICCCFHLSSSALSRRSELSPSPPQAHRPLAIPATTKSHPRRAHFLFYNLFDTPTAKFGAIASNRSTPRRAPVMKTAINMITCALAFWLAALVGAISPPLTEGTQSFNVTVSLSMSTSQKYRELY